MAADNRTLTRFELTGIPPAPRGVPKIQVTFRIDANGVVSIDAKDLGTGRSQQVKVTTQSGLSQAEVDKLVDEGETFKATDEVRRELAELRNQAEMLLYTTEQALDGYADLVDMNVLAETKEAAVHLKSLLGTGGDLSAVRDAYQRLEALTFSIAETMYGSPADPPVEEPPA
jgi:molecular chaperone DnaK